MKALKVIVGLLTVFVVAPIWYYLLYKVLQAINATELMWFLYWIYVPVSILGRIVSDIAGAAGNS
jgi:hypothetical protein